MTTTAIANDATDLGSILQAAMAGSYVAHGSGQTFTVNKTIVINIDSTTQGPLGLDLGGSTIISNITDGSPVIKVVVGPNVDLRYLTFANFTIQGNGNEGSGIQIVAGGNDRWVYNFSVDNVTVDHVGGYGLDVQGSVFEGSVSNSWMTNDGKGGAYFSHFSEGQASALRWFGGGLENNGGAGMTLDHGTRDMSVDGARFAGNQGAGISAESGITAVTNSQFIDNHGPGVSFQNYGNFNDNSFETSGAQAVGVVGVLAGNATLLGNTTIWTGSGADPTTLANIGGRGDVFATGDSGKIVTGSSVSLSSAGSVGHSDVSVGTQGVDAPESSAVTAAMTEATATSNTGSPVEAALKAAVATGSAHLTDSGYTVGAPIVINLGDAAQGPIDIDFGGAKIQSTIKGGGPVIQIVAGAGVNVSQLTLSNLMINGSGGEGDGIRIVADGSDRSINLSVNSVQVEHVGGIGLDVIGNVHGTVFNSWMNGNAGGGARFANGLNGGVADDLSWVGGGFRHNPVAGLILDNGAHDMTVKGAYFVENDGVGVHAKSGITLIEGSGFENNGGTAVVTNGTAALVNDTFSTWGPQTVAVGGTLAGGQVNMTGVNAEYYGPGSDPTVLANLQGSGQLAVPHGSKAIAGPDITVTGSAWASVGTVGAPAPTDHADATVTVSADGTPTDAHTVVASSTDAAPNTGSADVADNTASADVAHNTGSAAPGSTGPDLAFTDAAWADGKITVSGSTGEAGDTVWIYDGSSWSGAATTDAGGKFSFSESGALGSTHNFFGIALDPAGHESKTMTPFVYTATTEKLSIDTGASATDHVTSQATAPEFTGGSSADGQATITGAGGAGDAVSIPEGTGLAGVATADATGKFSSAPAAAADSPHTYSATDVAGNPGSGGAGNDLLHGGTGGVMTGTQGSDTFFFDRGQANGVTITDFETGVDHLQFAGYGTAPGGTVTQIDATHLSIAADGVAPEIITLSNAATIHHGDYAFV